MPGRHSAKEKRQAKHVAASERERGMDPKEAESVGWATVNKQKKKKRKVKKGLAEYGTAAAHQTVNNPPAQPSYGTRPSPTSHTRPIMPIGGGSSSSSSGQNNSSSPSLEHEAPHVTKAGESYRAPASTREKIRTRGSLSAAASRRQFDRHVDEGAKQVRAGKQVTPHFVPSTDEHGIGNFHVLKQKSIRVMTIDEAFAEMHKADAPPAPAAPGAPKKFPRELSKPHADDFSDEAPTVTMKPSRTTPHGHKMRAIGDDEAMANIKTGEHKKEVGAHNNYDKSIRRSFRRALSTGYTSISGGGALRAPNRGFMLTFEDLSRAVAERHPPSVPPPVPGSSKRPYLPGVHPVSAKPKYGDPGRVMGMPSKKTKKASMAETTDSVVHKSGGDPTMSKTNFNDLFKSELATPGDEVLCDCPHCETPITKSDLEKGSAHVAEANKRGKTMHGGSGSGTLKPSRGVPGAKKHDEPAGVQNSKGSKGVKKAEIEEAPDQVEEETPPAQTQQVKKSISVRGTEWVQYIDDGEDAALAKSISEGSLGGTPPTQPLDLNHDLTRLLV